MKKLMIFVLAALVGFVEANAQITQGRIGTGNITIWGTDWNDVYGLDFDNDGTLEIRISDFESTPTIYNGAFSYDYADNGTNILADENGWDYVGVLDAGVTVGSASTSLFAGYGDAYFDGTNITLGTHYLGLRISLADGVHYGWAEYTMTQEGGDYRATFNSCYYNATVGADIVTGDTGGGSGENECVKTIPFTEAFEGISSGIPDCWSQEASNLSSSKWDFSSTGRSGNCVFFEDYNGYNSRLILPVVDCSTLGANAQLSFYFKNPAISNGSFANLAIYYRTSESDEWTVVSDWSLTAATEDWTSVDIILPASAGAATYQVSFLATGVETYPKVPVYLDDVTIGEAPSCLRPSNLAAVATDTSLVLSWTENGSATQWLVKVGDGDYQLVDANPYITSILDPNTDYSVWVRAYCGSDTSADVTGTFRTACGAQTLPYTEDFESYTGGAYSGDMPDCWHSISGTNFVQNNTTYAANGNQSLHIQGPGVVATSPLALNGSNIDVIFSLRKEGDNSGYMLVGLAADYNDLTTAVWQDTIKPASNAVYYDYDFTFTNSAATGYLVFKQVEATSSWYYWFDDLSITVSSGCARPESGSISNVAITTADVEWNAVDGATGYKVAYGTENDPEAATVVTSATNSKTITGLRAETTYYVWVATECGGAQSTWRYIGNMTTQIACAQVVDANVTNRAETAIALGWTIDTTIGYTSTEVEVAYKETGATEWITANTEDNFYIITGLTGGTTYDFRINNICGDDTATATTLTATTSMCGEIANGNTDCYIPARPYYKYSYTQAIYPAAEVASFGDIASISFYYNGTSTTRTVDVYIADMDDPSFENGYIDINEFTQVASNYSWSIASDEWSEIVFDAPFHHVSGKSIVIAVNDKTGGYAGSYSDRFLGHSGLGVYQHVDGSTAYDPANPGNGTASTVVPNIRFNTTCNTSCIAPVVALANTTQHEATVSWIALGTETSWTAEYRVIGATEWAVANDNISGTSSYTFTNLLQGTYYEFRIGANCGEDHAYCNVTGVTGCGIFDVPYTEDFNSGELSPCWVVGTNAPYIYNGRLYNYYYTNGFAILPPFSEAINTLRINFDAEYTGYSTCTVQIGVVDDQSGIESFELVETVTVTSGQTAYEVMFNNYTGSGRNIAIKLPVGYVYMDNLVVSRIPSCLAPTAFAADAITPVSAELSWTHDATDFEIKYRAEGGEWLTATSETTSVTLTGLRAATDYDVEIRAICTGNDSSEVLAGTFTTEIACADVTALSINSVTTSSITIGWTIDGSTGYESSAVLVEYKEADASDWTEAVATGNNFTLGNIGEGETYNFRVRNVCGNDTANYVSITATSKICGELADGTSTGYIPTYTYYKYTYSQAIYPAAVVESFGDISGMSFFYNGSSAITRTVDVYIADMDNPSFDNGFIDITAFTQVATDYPWNIASNDWSGIVFDEPFNHVAGKSIVIALNDKTGSDPGTYASMFVSHSGVGLYARNDGSQYDPSDPGSGNPSTVVPNVRFTTNCIEPEQPATCEVPTGLAVNDITENTAVVSWNDVELPATDEGFVGEWNLTMAAGAQIHRTVTLDATLHTMLGYAGRDIDDIDEDASIASAPMPVTIEQGTGDQVNVSGTFSVELMDGIDPISFDFATTGTVSSNGLAIEPADLTQSITLLGAMPVNLTGTVTFVQPTELPENGVLTLEIASLDVDGTGTMMGGTATMSITGTDIQASGTKEATTSEYPKYEIVITNTATDVETNVSDVTSPYTAENLTASTGYTVKVRTICDENTTSDWSEAVPFITLDSQQPEPCDEPTDVTATNVTANTATISWTGTAPQYEVEINDQTIQVATNSYDAQGFTASTTYSVRVRSLCNGETSDWTTAISFTTLAGGDEPEACSTPVNVTVSDITTNSAVVSWQAGVANETFDGEWNLVLADNDSVHMVITPDEGMHAILQFVGNDIDNIDENVSVAGTMVPVTIEPGTGNQMNISGSFDMDMYGVDDPVTFHFATTGTVSNNTLTIAPANINETVLIMDAMAIDYIGTVTFVQPTALPIDGNLTIGIATMDISGYGDTTISMYGMTMSGSVTISMTGSQLSARGPRVSETADSRVYELVVTNPDTGVETTVNPATSPYTVQNLTASTAYTVKVRTICDGGTTSEWTAVVPFTTLDQGVEPDTCDVPTNVDVAVTATTAEVTWTGSASEYQIEVSGAGNTFTLTVSASPYTVEGLTASTNYTVRVRALCDNGVTSNWSPVVNLTTLQQGGETDNCNVPTNMATLNLTPTSATITWEGEARSYEVEFRNTTIVVYENSYDALSLTPATTYTIRVRAICEPGVTSDWCEVFSFTTPEEGEQQGIGDVNGAYNVNIYPNPARENVTVSVEGMRGKAEVNVIDMSGRTVMTLPMEASVVKLNVSSLAQGTYFVRISGESISTVRKLVIR